MIDDRRRKTEQSINSGWNDFLPAVYSIGLYSSLVCRRPMTCVTKNSCFAPRLTSQSASSAHILSSLPINECTTKTPLPQNPLYKDTFFGWHLTFLRATLAYIGLFLRATARICHANSVRPSVTRVYCIKTAERIIEILSRSDRPIILVFRHQRSLHKSDGFTPTGMPNTRGVSIFDCGYISETVITGCAVAAALL